MDAQLLLIITLAVLTAFLAGLCLGAYLVYKAFRAQPAPKSTLTKDEEEAVRKYDQTVVNHLVIPSKDHQQGSLLNLTDDELERLHKMARAIARGTDLNGELWSGKGKLWSRAEYEHLIDIFMLRGWVAWENAKAHSQGVWITSPGVDFFFRLAGHRPPHPTAKDFEPLNRLPVTCVQTCIQRTA